MNGNIDAALMPEIPSNLSPDARQEREQRLQLLQAKSDERWMTRKRRRRTRGWAGLPPDPPGPPRFPSETTLDESKVFLSLDNDSYRQLRDQFQAICLQEGVLKKTSVGAIKWQSVKDKLVQENGGLQNVFWNDQLHKTEQKALALEVICIDVTKRMRMAESRMTIAEAKNALGLNPEEGRQIRTAFYDILLADNFTSKAQTGDEHWNELKSTWMANSEILQRVFAVSEAGPDHIAKLKALDVLCRDVMKRLRDDQKRREPSSRRQVDDVPGPEPTAPMSNAISSPSLAKTNYSTTVSTEPMLSIQASDSAFQIDPSLLLAASNPPNAPHRVNSSFSNANLVDGHFTLHPATAPVYSD